MQGYSRVHARTMSYCFHCFVYNFRLDRKNIAKHTAHTIVSWPDPKHCLMIHISELMLLIRWSANILTIIKREIVKLKNLSPLGCVNIIAKMNLIVDSPWYNSSRLYLNHTISNTFNSEVSECVSLSVPRGYPAILDFRQKKAIA